MTINEPKLNMLRTLPVLGMKRQLLPHALSRSQTMCSSGQSIKQTCTYSFSQVEDHQPSSSQFALSELCQPLNLEFKMTINEPKTNTWHEKAAAAHTACNLLRAHGICLFVPSSGRVHTHFCVWLIYCHFIVILTPN